MLYPNIETFIGCESSYEEADMVLYGAPFDSTTSYRPGATGWRPSALIRRRICATAGSLTAGIWSCALAAARRLWRISRPGQSRFFQMGNSPFY